MLSSCMVKNCVEVLKRHVWICISFVYLTKQFRSEALLNESIYISVGVWQGGGNFDTSENCIFKALALLNCKLDFIFTYIPNLDIPPKILRGAYQRIF
jgi:hypothetical protein